VTTRAHLGLIICAAALLPAGAARADADASPTEPAPPAERSHIGFYGVGSLWAGWINGEIPTYYRLSDGLASRRPGHRPMRVGGTIDFVRSRNDGETYGAEMEFGLTAHDPLAWVRVSASLGNGNGTPQTGGDLSGTVGLRLRRSWISGGVDLMGVSGRDESAVGVLAGVGLDGEPGGYLLTGSAVVVTVAAVLLVLFPPNLH